MGVFIKFAEMRPDIRVLRFSGRWVRGPRGGQAWLPEGKANDPENYLYGADAEAAAAAAGESKTKSGDRQPNSAGESMDSFAGKTEPIGPAAGQVARSISQAVGGAQVADFQSGVEAVGNAKSDQSAKQAAESWGGKIVRKGKEFVGRVVAGFKKLGEMVSQSRLGNPLGWLRTGAKKAGIKTLGMLAFGLAASLGAAGVAGAGLAAAGVSGLANTAVRAGIYFAGAYKTVSSIANRPKKERKISWRLLEPITAGEPPAGVEHKPIRRDAAFRRIALDAEYEFYEELKAQEEKQKSGSPIVRHRKAAKLALAAMAAKYGDRFKATYKPQHGFYLTPHGGFTKR